MLAWSYRLGKPEFTPATLGTDCGLIFRSDLVACKSAYPFDLLPQIAKLLLV